MTFIVSTWIVCCAFASVWLLGRKNRLGWLVMLGQNLTWVVWAPFTGQWPLALSGAVFAAMGIRNYRAWTADDSEKVST